MGDARRVAAVTERIRLGTMVSPATFRRPSVLARMVATADHISGGRIELGLGAGWNAREHEAHGFPFPDLGERMEILEEQLEIIHRQWTEEESRSKAATTGSSAVAPSRSRSSSRIRR